MPSTPDPRHPFPPLPTDCEPPPLPAGFKPVPTPRQTGIAIARGWKALGWKAKLLVCCGAYVAVVLAVLPIIVVRQAMSARPTESARAPSMDAPSEQPPKTLAVTDGPTKPRKQPVNEDSHKSFGKVPTVTAPKGNLPKNEKSESRDSPKPKVTAKEKAKAADHKLYSGHLATGEMGTLGCNLVEIIRIYDDRLCLVTPLLMVDRSLYGRLGEQIAVRFDHQRQLPVLLTGWPTAGKVTGQKEDLSGVVFLVTGTKDLKKTDGGVLRVHVLELVE